jgi:hypothetical protein
LMRGTARPNPVFNPPETASGQSAGRPIRSETSASGRSSTGRGALSLRHYFNCTAISFIMS